MAFKTFTCVRYGANQSVPAAGYNIEGDTLLLLDNTTILQYVTCDPKLSYFNGSNIAQTENFTSSDFYALWTGLLGVLVIASTLKYIRAQIR